MLRENIEILGKSEDAVFYTKQQNLVTTLKKELKLQIKPSKRESG